MFKIFKPNIVQLCSLGLIILGQQETCISALVVANKGKSVVSHYRFQPELFDLGYEYIEGETLFYPGQRFEYELYEDIKGYNFTEPEHIKFFFAMYSFCMGEHGGTHVDAPFHFNEFGWKVGEIPPNRMVDVPTVIVDVEEEVFSSPNPQDFRVDLKYFLEYERAYGPIPTGAIVLINTGWARFWPEKDVYFGKKSDGTVNFPGISGEAAKFLARERKIVGIGIDTASIDVGNFKGTLAAHLELCGNNIYIIENVANLNVLLLKIRPSISPITSSLSSSLYSDQCDLRTIVLPIKSRGTGGPCRVISYCKN